MEITLTAQQRRVYRFTLSAQCWQGRWYMKNSPLPYGYVCSHFFSDYDKSSSMQCRLMMENECWIAFNVAGSETGTTAYNLHMYGRFPQQHRQQHKTRQVAWVPSHYGLFRSQVARSLPTSPSLFWGCPSPLCAWAWSCWVCGRCWCRSTTAKRWLSLKLRERRQNGKRYDLQVVVKIKLKLFSLMSLFLNLKWVVIVKSLCDKPESGKSYSPRDLNLYIWSKYNLLSISKHIKGAIWHDIIVLYYIIKLIPTNKNISFVFFLWFPFRGPTLCSEAPRLHSKM